MSAPEIIIPRMIYRPFVLEHPNWIFLYGDTMYKTGMLGQPFHLCGESNTYPIPTCVKHCRSNRYFSDGQFDEYSIVIDRAIFAVPEDGRPVIPLRRMGEGCSRLSELCPKLFAHLKSRLKIIAYPNIKIDYHAN